MAINGATVLQTNGVGTLSGGNLSYSSAVTNNLCRATRPMNGPTYWEVTPTASSLLTSTYTGICGSSLNFSGLQASTWAIHFDSDGGVRQSGNLIGTINTWALNQRQDWAYIPALGRLWIRVAGGNWNNSGTADPATNTGGLDIYAAPSVFSQAGGLVPAFSATNSGCGVTFALSAANFVGTPPTGFSSIDVQQFTMRNFEETFLGEMLPLVAKEFGPIARCIQMPNDRYQNLWTPATPIKFVRGYTKENGVIVGNKRVELYDRITGDLIQSTVSDGTGYFQLPTVGRTAVRVVGSDPTSFNSIVWDNVPAVA